jgi:hypothetical protein
MPFFGRPFKVITHNGIVAALTEAIADPILARMSQQRPIGSLDLFSDNTDLVAAVTRRVAIKHLIEAVERSRPERS